MPGWGTAQLNETEVDRQQHLTNFAAWYNTCDFDRCARTEELVYMEHIDTGVFTDVRLDPVLGGEKPVSQSIRRATPWAGAVLP